jgi:hypothetical protein
MSHFIDLQTISGRTILVRSNKSKGTFTIKTESGKYRTYPMGKEDLSSASKWTSNQWQQCLKTMSYFKI